VPQVKALVYIAGFAPDEGESLVKLVTMNPGSQIAKNLITRKYALPGGGEGTDLYLTKRGFETAFAGDVPRRLADRTSWRPRTTRFRPRLSASWLGARTRRCPR
jgi:hypothetical protein